MCPSLSFGERIGSLGLDCSAQKVGGKVKPTVVDFVEPVPQTFMGHFTHIGVFQTFIFHGFLGSKGTIYLGVQDDPSYLTLFVRFAWLLYCGMFFDHIRHCQ